MRGAGALCGAVPGAGGLRENPPPSSPSGGSALGFEGEEAPDYNLITGQPLAEGMAAGQRPVAVMVRAERAGWPQSGLAGADALVEMATQGGHTALMALGCQCRRPAAGGPCWPPVGPAPAACHGGGRRVRAHRRQRVCGKPAEREELSGRGRKICGHTELCVYDRAQGVRQ